MPSQVALTNPNNHTKVTVSLPLLMDLFATCKRQCPECRAEDFYAEQVAADAYRCRQCAYTGPDGDWRLGWLCETLRNTVAEKLRAETLQAQLVQTMHAQCPTCAANLAYLNGGPMPEHLRNENVTHAARPANTGRNRGCAFRFGGEHAWSPLLPGSTYEVCPCGARRMQCTSPNLQSIPRDSSVARKLRPSPGLVYVAIPSAPSVHDLCRHHMGFAITRNPDGTWVHQCVVCWVSYHTHSPTSIAHVDPTWDEGNMQHTLGDEGSARDTRVNQGTGPKLLPPYAGEQSL